MKIFYSPIKDACYPEEFKDAYLEASTWPEDAVEISIEEYSKFFLQEPPKNVARIYKEDTGFNWVPIKTLITGEQKELEERLWRNSELYRSDIELNKVQDSDPKARGSVSAWREYRKALRAIPEQVGFPLSVDRPIPPDSV